MNRRIQQVVVAAAMVAVISTAGCKTGSQKDSETHQVRERDNVHNITFSNEVYAAHRGVVRIVGERGCGTGFLHKSGVIITAWHVIAGSKPEGVKVVFGRRGQVIVSINRMIMDPVRDIALLEPAVPLPLPPLPISGEDDFRVGMTVDAWGYPAGYRGEEPVLVRGYFSAIDLVPTPGGELRQYLLNAAVNKGQSGGPLFNDKGEVMGLVVSKCAPLTDDVVRALNYLREQNPSVIFEIVKDGNKTSVVQNQMLSTLFDYFNDQVQLNMGRAVLAGDIRDVLGKAGYQP